MDPPVAKKTLLHYSLLPLPKKKNREAVLQNIFYFSALAKHIDSRIPGTTRDHKRYIDCLRSTGIIDVMGRFKPKKIKCKACNSTNLHHEEKETDVAISIKLFELFYLNECDTAVFVSGDTDIAPAVRTVKRLFPTKDVCFAFPY